MQEPFQKQIPQTNQKWKKQNVINTTTNIKLASKSP